MFNSSTSTGKTLLVAVSIALSAISIDAQATLAGYTNGGVDLVYSSVSNVTWTKDANLFKTLYAADNTLISKIAAVTPTYNDRWFGLQTISDGKISPLDFDDFNTDTGAVTWWGGLAFVSYLNSITYGGSNQWYLPTVSNAITGYNTPTNGTAKGDELVELFYQETGSVGVPAGFGIKDPNNIFDNEQANNYYWYGTQHPQFSYAAMGFDTIFGFKDYAGKEKNTRVAWFVTAGDLRPAPLTAVPEPAATWLFVSGLLGVMGLHHRKQRA